MAALFDIQGVQSRQHGERGIARYLNELARALAATQPGAVAEYLLNPDLAVPGFVEPLATTGRLNYVDRIMTPHAHVFHVGSPFELGIPLKRIWPTFARGRMRLVVTLYDLIPLLFSNRYLADPLTKRSYLARLALVRRADRVLAISERTARDAIEHLGIDRSRVEVVGAGVGPLFRPPEDRRFALTAARALIPGLGERYLLYTGGIESRKNIDRLLRAYASMPQELREEHELVIVCRVSPEQRLALDSRFAELGLAGRVRLTGYVSDRALVNLYQAAHLFIFPSLYEGYGLPIAEARACGAPVIASRSSSSVELVHAAPALFDPLDTRSIAEALERVLKGEALRARLLAEPLGPEHRWEAVADRTAAVYQSLKPPAKRRWAKPRIAYVSPLPPHASGIADYSYRLLAELRHSCNVDAFTDTSFGDGQAPTGVRVADVRTLDVVEGTRGGYERVFVCIGNSEHHVEALDLVRRRRAIVLAHDVRLTGLYAYAADHRPDIQPLSFRSEIARMYENRLPALLGASGFLEPAEAQREGLVMAREVLALAERYIVHSRYAAQLARLEAGSGDESKIRVVPFGFDPPTGERSKPSQPSLVASFGIVASAKQPGKLVAAFSRLIERHPRATLAFVGRILDPREEARLRTQALELGIAHRIHFTGHVTNAEFRRWLWRTSVAVQLRAVSQGESPASVTDTLVAGVPTIVTQIGAAAELPDPCVVKVAVDIAPSDLAQKISLLLREEARWNAMSRSSIEYAREHTFGMAARAILDAAEVETRR